MMVGRTLITSFECQYINCSCGTEIIVTKQREALTECKTCGSLYDEKGKFIMKPLLMPTMPALTEYNSVN